MNMKLTSSANAAFFYLCVDLTSLFPASNSSSVSSHDKSSFQIFETNLYFESNFFILDNTYESLDRAICLYHLLVFSIAECLHFFLGSLTCFVNLLFDSLLAFYVPEFGSFAPTIYLLA